LVKLTSVTWLAVTRTVAVRLARLLLTRAALGDAVMAETTVPATAVSVTTTSPAATSMGRLHEPAWAVVVTPPTVKVNVCPVAIPAPAILQTLTEPFGGGVVLLVNVTTVCEPSPPSTTCTVADRFGRLVETDRPAGATAMSTSSVPARAVSVTVAWPAGSSMALAQPPTGAVTAVVVPPAATVKVKLPVRLSPAGAFLHTSRKPFGVTLLVNVAIVWVPAPPATTVTVAVRAARSLLTRLAAGAAVMSATTNPARAVSVITTWPALTVIGWLHPFTGTETDPVMPETVNAKLPSTPGPEAFLQISRTPVGGVPVAWAAVGTLNPAATTTHEIKALKREYRRRTLIMDPPRDPRSGMCRDQPDDTYGSGRPRNVARVISGACAPHIARLGNQSSEPEMPGQYIDVSRSMISLRGRDMPCASTEERRPGRH
jgi:hypothetical protein